MFLGLQDLARQREYRKNLLILPLLAFIVNLGFGAISAILPYFILYLAGSLKTLPEELGIIQGASSYAVEFGTLMSLFMLTRAFLARYFGIYSDKIGRKKIIILGITLYTLVSFLYIVAPDLNWLYIIRMLQGIASAMVWPVAEALLMDSVSHEVRGRAMGIYMAATTFSFVGGPAIGVGMYKIGVIYLGLREVGEALRFPFILLTALSLVSLALTFLLKETLVKKEVEKAVQKTEKKIRLPKNVKRSVDALYIIGFSNGVAMGLVAPFMMLYIVEYITSDPTALAIVSFISGLAGIAATYPAGYLSDKIGRRKIIISGIIASRTSTLLLPFTRTLDQLTAIATLRNIAFNFYIPSFRALQADLVPKEIRGRIFGTIQMFFNLGAVLGPIIGGALYKNLAETHIYGIPGVAFTFLSSAVLGYLSLIVFILFVKEEKTTKKL